MLMYVMILGFVTVVMALFFITFGDKVSYNLMVRMIWMVVAASISTGALKLAHHYGWLSGGGV